MKIKQKEAGIGPFKKENGIGHLKYCSGNATLK